MTWICRRGYRHTALLWRFEFCRDLPLCFDFLILKLSLPQPAKIGPLPFQLPRCCLTAAGLPWLCTRAGLSMGLSGPDPWDNSLRDFAAASAPLWSVCAVCAFSLSLVLGLHKGIGAECCWTDRVVCLALGACRLSCWLWKHRWRC